MRRTVAAVLLGFIPALATAAEAASDTEEDRHETPLAAGGRMELAPLLLERTAVHVISCDGRRLTIRAVPGGLIRFAGSDGKVRVWVLDTEGRAVTFTLRGAEQASVWPVRRVEVVGKTEEFAAILTSADWAFVVRADRAPEGGLRARCHGVPCTLREGQRLDADRADGKTVFRVIGDGWPGRLVEAPEPAPSRAVALRRAGAPEEKGKERREVRAVAAEEAPPPRGGSPLRRGEGPPPEPPPLPILTTGTAAWEVRPARPRSP
jgi:hypothetical protein